MEYGIVFLGLLAMVGIVLLMPSEGDVNRKEWNGMELGYLNDAEDYHQDYYLKKGMDVDIEIRAFIPFALFNPRRDFCSK